MRIEKPRRVSHTYTQHLVAPPDRVFPLLCPVREAEWLDGWDPLWVASNSGVAEPDGVFITQSAGLPEAIWYITRHEPDRGLVEMIKITPDVTACRLRIQVRAAPAGSEAVVTYGHTSLGPSGDALVASFTAAYYAQFMRDWESRMNYFLTHGAMLREGGS